MTFEPTWYTAIYLSAALIATGASMLAWSRRSAPGGWPLFLVLHSAVVWCAADALESAVVGLPAHVLWAQVAYVGNMAVGPMLVMFALAFTGRRPLPQLGVASLFLVPVVGLVGAATNAWHHLIWTSFAEVPGGANLVAYSHGWLYWVVALYAISVTLASIIMLAGFALRAKAPYRQQGVAVLVAVLVPWAAEFVYWLTPGVLPGVDPSVTIAISASLMTVGLLRLGLLDLVPVAREKLVESMEDGLLVLDGGNRLLDSNPAAAAIVGHTEGDWIGAQIGLALASWPELAECLGSSHCEEGDGLFLSPAGRTINVRSMLVDNKRGPLAGRMIILRDATQQAETHAELESMNADLHERIMQVEELQEELREQAIRDPLTGLFNRRYLNATLHREIGRADREGYPVSLVMIDADHFKRVNDEHGHAAGDQVLRFLGAQLLAGLRTGDIACRYGGDEFLMVLPNTRLENARTRAEEWRSAVRQSSVGWTEWGEPTTLSMGVAAFPEHGALAEEVMTAADAALYDAKHSGRDRVSVSDGTELPGSPTGSAG